MKSVFCILAFYFVLVSGDVEFNTSTSGIQTSNVGNEVLVPSSSWNELESNVSVLDVYHKITDGVVSFKNKSDLFDDNFDLFLQFGDLDSNSSVIEDVDADGCDRLLRKQLEKRCDDEYEKVNSEANTVEDVMEQAEALCCAVEDFEKCNLRALDKANCGKDKAAIKENMKAARLFITVISNVKCSQFRGLCASSSAPNDPTTYAFGFGAVLSLVILFESLLI